VVGREPDAALQLLVAADLHVGGCPALGPGGRAALQHRRQPHRDRLAKPPRRLGGGVGVVAAGEHRDQLVQPPRPSWDHLEAVALHQGPLAGLVLLGRRGAVTGGEHRGGG
jgi:hypothetical protein